MSEKSNSAENFVLNSAIPKVPIRLGSKISKQTKKRIGVRTKPTDSLGAAPLPAGYLEHLASSAVPKVNVPTSYQENKIIHEESRPYIAPTNNKKNKAVTMRTAGGEVWIDNSLADWDENDFRLFVGDLGNEVNDSLLTKSFSQYRSLLRTHVVKDKKTGRSKGYGFVSFGNSDDFVKAMREMNGNLIF
jgi:hypothetical protein